MTEKKYVPVLRGYTHGQKSRYNYGLRIKPLMCADLQDYRVPDDPGEVVKQATGEKTPGLFADSIPVPDETNK